MTDSEAREMLVLSWQPMCLELWALGEEPSVGFQPRTRLDSALTPDQRYDASLRMTKAEQGWLRLPIGQRSLFIRVEDKGHILASVPPVPGQGSLALNNCRAHACDLVTVIDGTHLFFLGADKCWYRRVLPTDITVNDVSFDPYGGLWLAGKVASRRIPNAKNEVAIRYQAPGTTSFDSRSPRLDLLTAAKTIRDGGLEELYAINAEGKPLVAISNCAWFVDDPSSFLFLHSDRGYWNVKRLVGQFIRRLIQASSSTLLVVTADGDILAVTADNAVRLIGTAAKLRMVLLCAYPQASSAAKLLIRGADAEAETLVVVAGLYVTTETQLSWLITAVCLSKDAGVNWTLLAKTAPVEGEPELLDIALIRHY